MRSAIDRTKWAAMVVGCFLVFGGCSEEDEENAETPEENDENQNIVDNDWEPPLVWSYPDPYVDGDEVDWVVETGATYARLPAVDADGGLVFGDWKGVLRRVNADTGDVSWEFEAQGRIDAAPAIGDDGSIYFGDWSGVVYALDAQGDELWTYDTGAIVDVSPTIDGDGKIWVGDDAGFVHVLSPQGDLEDSIDLEAPITSAVSISIDGGDWRAYVATADDSVHCLTDVDERTSAVLQGQVGVDVAIAPNGDALVTTDNGGLARLDEQCDVIWEEDRTWATLMPAAIAGEGQMWVWGHNRQMYRIDIDTGSTEHQEGAPIRGNATTAPVVADDGRVLVSTRGVVYFDGDDAGILTRLDAMDAPVLVDGAAIVNTERGAVLRLAGDWPALGDSSWPTQHGNLARTGRVEH